LYSNEFGSGYLKGNYVIYISFFKCYLNWPVHKYSVVSLPRSWASEKPP
jgi:hypothetical protein